MGNHLDVHPDSVADLPQRDEEDSGRAGYPTIFSGILMGVNTCIHTYMYSTHTCTIYIYEVVMCDTKNSVLMARWLSTKMYLPASLTT